MNEDFTKISRNLIRHPDRLGLSKDGVLFLIVVMTYEGEEILDKILPFSDEFIRKARKEVLSTQFVSIESRKGIGNKYFVDIKKMTELIGDVKDGVKLKTYSGYEEYNVNLLQNFNKYGLSRQEVMFLLELITHENNFKLTDKILGYTKKVAGRLRTLLERKGLIDYATTYCRYTTYKINNSAILALVNGYFEYTRKVNEPLTEKETERKKKYELEHRIHLQRIKNNLVRTGNASLYIELQKEKKRLEKENQEVRKLWGLEP